ncbi:MAG: NYN domain-containing protein [Methanomassiliicoccus sp.]|nr:NYN domain-containing protein [Methanomassiliicoccus sp.]
MDEKRIEDRQLAFLVDGDNAQATMIEEMLAEASKYGSVIIRRVYGNWTAGGQVNSWKTKLKEYALSPYQQFPNISNRYVTKNATDIALIIDAMDILHDGIVKGFVIVSSDSDYTSLAIKIREHGLFVIGIGKKETHDSFRRACDVFVSTENLGKEDEEEKEAPKAPKGQTRPRKTPRDAMDILNRAFDYAVNDDGRALNGDIGAALRRLDPAFDTRTYGKASLLNLIDELDDVFEVERANHGAIYVRRKSENRTIPPAEEQRAPEQEKKEAPCSRTVNDALPLLMEAYRIVDKNSDGTADTFRMFKAAKKVDPTFDSANYGKEKISHLLEALPDHFALVRRGKSMLVRRVERAEEEIEAEAPVEEKTEDKAPAEPEVPEAADLLPPRSSIDLLKVVTAAFDRVVKDDGLAYLPQLSKEVKREDPDLDFKTYGKAGLREYLEEFDDVFTLHKKGRNVYVSKRKGKRPSQHISELVK